MDFVRKELEAPWDRPKWSVLQPYQPQQHMAYMVSLIFSAHKMACRRLHGTWCIPTAVPSFLVWFGSPWEFVGKIQVTYEKEHVMTFVEIRSMRNRNLEPFFDLF